MYVSVPMYVAFLFVDRVVSSAALLYIQTVKGTTK